MCLAARKAVELGFTSARGGLWAVYRRVETQGFPTRTTEGAGFSTPRDLLARFGEPTRIRGEEEGDVCWIYRRPPESGPTLQATVSMLDGYVTGLDLRFP